MALAGRASEQIALRLPDGMRDRLKAVADANGRSANSEIIVALKAHLAATGEEIGVQAPAAASINNVALASGASITNG